MADLKLQAGAVLILIADLGVRAAGWSGRVLPNCSGRRAIPGAARRGAETRIFADECEDASCRGIPGIPPSLKQRIAGSCSRAAADTQRISAGNRRPRWRRTDRDRLIIAANVTGSPFADMSCREHQPPTRFAGRRRLRQSAAGSAIDPPAEGDPPRGGCGGLNVVAVFGRNDLDAVFSGQLGSHDGGYSVGAARAKLRRPRLKPIIGSETSAIAISGSRASSTIKSAGFPTAMP